MPATIEYYGEHCKSGVPVEDRRAYLAHAMSLGYPIVTKGESNCRPLAIVGGGPSVNDDVRELRSWKSRGKDAEVWATNGALFWCVKNGINVDGFVACDSSPLIAKYLTLRPMRATFYLSSTCHPETFAAVAGLDIRIWHAGVNDLEYPKGQGVVGGGPTIMTRVPMLAHCIGYRDVHLFGVDSSYEGDQSHAYEMKFPQKKNRINVLLDGKIYNTEAEFLHQVAYLQAISAYFEEGGAKFEVHGRGLGPDIFKAKMHSEEEILARANAA